MEILNESKSTDCRMEMGLTNDEYAQMVAYCDSNISKKELDDLKVEWAINNILLKAVNKGVDNG